MEIINGLHNLRSRHRGCVLTIGNFDGVHRGHRQLIDALCEKAKALGVPSMLMTFEPQPREFFAGTKLPARLTRFREKVYLLDQTPLDRLLCLPFNDRTANIEADWFANDFVVDQVGAKHLVIGDDFRFGRGREGDFALFERYGRIHGYSVSAMSTLLQGEARISSTLIREILAAGISPQRQIFWSRILHHGASGIRSSARSSAERTHGEYSTAALSRSPRRGLLRDRRGYCRCGAPRYRQHWSSTDSRRQGADLRGAYIRLHRQFYGDLIKVTFKQKLREEQAFDSIDALKTQINQDIEQARHYFDE